MYEETRAPATWPTIDNEFQARRLANFPNEPDAVWRDITEEEMPAVIGTLIRDRNAELTIRVTRAENGNLDIAHQKGYRLDLPPTMGGRELPDVAMPLTRKAGEMPAFFRECRESGVLQSPGVCWHMTVHRDGWFYL